MSWIVLLKADQQRCQTDQQSERGDANDQLSEAARSSNSKMRATTTMVREFGRRTSPIWDHYTFIKLYDGVFCRMSQSQYRYSTRVSVLAIEYLYSALLKKGFGILVSKVSTDTSYQYRLPSFDLAVKDRGSSFSGSKHPTSNFYLANVVAIENLLCDAHNDPYEGISAMAGPLLELYEKYWSDHSTILSFVVLLNPRYKLQLLKELYSVLYVEDEVEMRNFDVNLAASRSERSDVDSYISLPLLPRTEDAQFDILEYWKSKYVSFHVLSHKARDVLVIPITSFASESSFSMGWDFEQVKMLRYL
ncbi:hypothetical protein V6N12_033230 [Hibiscus sabdariffa]|uniref:Uncharacterized protein n=1 Tax=Hibiscus sabdariffa TaxID=183260 RepID=A0ABR2BC38_9ROSI